MAYTQDELKAMLAKARADGTYKPGYIKEIKFQEALKDQKKAHEAARTTRTTPSGLKITDSNGPVVYTNPETGRVNTSVDPTGLNVYADSRSPSAGKKGFYYNSAGEFVNGIMPDNYYYNDALGAMVEGKAGLPRQAESGMFSGGAYAGQEGDDALTNPFGPDAMAYNAEGQRIARPKTEAAATTTESTAAEDTGMLTGDAGSGTPAFGSQPATAEGRQQFLTNLTSAYAAGELTPEQAAKYKEAYLTNPDLTDEERDYMTEALSSTGREYSGMLTQGQSGSKDIQAWWKDINKLRRQDPAEFEAWVQSDPEMATRWFAWASNKGQNYGENDNFSREEARRRAATLAYQMSQEAGYGEDGKKDGKTYAYDFDTFKDVNSNWGEGDFWKIGTPQKTSESPFGEILNNPVVQTVGNLALPGYFAAGTLALNAANNGEVSWEDVGKAVISAAPLIGDKLAPIINASPIITTGGVVAGGNLLAGEDLKDSLMAGGTNILTNVAAGSVRDVIEGNSVSNTLGQVMPDEWANAVSSTIDTSVTPAVQDLLHPDLSDELTLADGTKVRYSELEKTTDGWADVDPQGNYTTLDGRTFNFDDVVTVGVFQRSDFSKALDFLNEIPGFPEGLDTLGKYLRWRLPPGGGSPVEGADGALLGGTPQTAGTNGGQQQQQQPTSLEEEADVLLSDITDGSDDINRDPLGDSLNELDNTLLGGFPGLEDVQTVTDNPDEGDITDDPLVPGTVPTTGTTGGGSYQPQQQVAAGGMLGGGSVAPYESGDLFDLIKIRASTPAAQKLRISHLANLQAQREFNS